MVSVGPVLAVQRAFPYLKNIALVGEGGQRIVFRARHDTFGDIAIKFPRYIGMDTRSLREVEICLTRTFPYVPRMFEADYANLATGRSFYIIEEFVEGEMLSKRLSRDQQLPLNDVLTLLKDLLTTVVELEKPPQIVHRDIKPDNIIVGTDGHYWLVDFGIARHLGMASLTASSDRMGPHTPGFAAPEVMLNRKRAISSQSDLFSIGVVAYVALCGTNPYSGMRYGVPADDGFVRANVAKKDVGKLIIPGDVEDELSNYINRLMQRFESRRPKDASTALTWFFDVLDKLNA